MKNLVESVKELGFDQAALVRLREEGGYEIVAGHRRQQAAELAGCTNLEGYGSDNAGANAQCP